MEKEAKTLRYIRLSVFLLTGLFVLISVVIVMLVPRAVNTMDRMDATLEKVNGLVVTAEKALESATAATDSANRVVEENADAVSDAMTKFNSVDFAALNRAINDLADIVEPLAKVVNYLNK